MTLQQVESELLTYSPQERLRIARLLLNSLPTEYVAVVASERQNPLLKWAGVFAAGPNDVAERAEEILLEAVDPVSGFGK